MNNSRLIWSRENNLNKEFLSFSSLPFQIYTYHEKKKSKTLNKQANNNLKNLSKHNKQKSNKSIPANINNIHRIIFLKIEKRDSATWFNHSPVPDPKSNLNLLFALKTDICFSMFYFSCSCFIFSDWYNYSQHRFVSGT